MPDGSHYAAIRETRTQGLQNALLLRPPSENQNPAILSINPSIWGEPHHVINIGPLLGARPSMAGGPAELEHATAMAFHAAGWPLQRIDEEFRIDLKSRDPLDIALLGRPLQRTCSRRSMRVSKRSSSLPSTPFGKLSISI
jgi:hypothetical protein